MLQRKTQFWVFIKPWRPKVLCQFEIIINVLDIHLNTYVMGLQPL